MALTSHYIDPKTASMKDQLLSFIPIKERHTGFNIAKGIYAALKGHQIPFTKVRQGINQILGFTTDNAANNETGMRELEELTNGEFKESQWVRCMAHVVNLSVQAFLKEMKASSKEYRDYQKSAMNFELNDNDDEDQSFIKVMHSLNIATHFCS